MAKRTTRKTAKRKTARKAPPRRRRNPSWDDEYVLPLDIPDDLQQEWLLKGKIGEEKFGKRVEPRIRETACSPRLWRKVAGPFRTRRAAWRHARKLRGKTNQREIKYGGIKGGPSCFSAFGVTPRAWQRGRRTRDWDVCQLPPERRRRCATRKKTTKKKASRKNPSKLVLRNPTRRPAAPRRRRAPTIFELLRGRKSISVDELKELGKKHAEFGRALRAHVRFHGTYPDSLEVAEIDVADPGFTVAWALGDQLAIEYDPHESSGRAGPPFRHEFKRGKQLTVSSPSGKGPFVVRRRGSRMRVTDRGIVD